MPLFISGRIIFCNSAEGDSRRFRERWGLIIDQSVEDISAVDSWLEGFKAEMNYNLDFPVH